MIGLPTETFVDVEAIAHLGERAGVEGRKIRRDINVTVSVSTFVPKPPAPFQWEAQIGVEETLEKQRYLPRRDRRQADALEIAAVVTREAPAISKKVRTVSGLLT